MSIAVKATKLSVEFGKFVALDEVSLELPTGQVIGFIGPSGAGKTTLIRTIVGRQKITSGEVEVLGEPAGSASLRSKLSYMTQDVSVYRDLTVRQNLEYFATMFGLSKSEVKTNVREILEAVHLTSHAAQLVEKLSGGQRQRVSLAIALIGKPELMVLDEPTVGLDPVLREEIWKLFHKLTDAGTTLVVSSHVMDEAERCDDLLLIRDGRILAHDTPAELCKKTGSKTVEKCFLKLVEKK